MIHVQFLFGNALYEAAHDGAPVFAMHSRGEWKVATSTGEKTYPSAAAVARDCKAFAGLDVLVGEDNEPLVKPFIRPRCRFTVYRKHCALFPKPRRATH